MRQNETRAGELAKTPTSLLDQENPNASSEYKALVRRLAQLLVEDTENGWDGEEPLTDGEVLQDTLEWTLDTHADLQTAVHDLVRKNTPRLTHAEFVAGFCWDGQEKAEKAAQTAANEDEAEPHWQNETCWHSAAVSLGDVS